MKAVICTAYGSPEVPRLAELEKPIPKNSEILIKVHATSVTAGDVRVRRFDVPLLFWLPIRLVLGLKRPKQPVLGVEYAGEIEEVGQSIQNFKIGDRVFGSTPSMKFGCHAEYTVQPEDGIIFKIPDSLSFHEVASVPFMGIGALYFVRKAQLKKGKKILIYGASGAVGTYAVQLAKYFGADVTAVCSLKNRELVQSIGADSVLDYTVSDFKLDREKYDVFFDTVGKCPFAIAIHSVKRKGLYITADRGLINTIRGSIINLIGTKKVIAGTAKPEPGDLEFLTDLMINGQLTSVIDKTFNFEEMSEAHRYVDSGRKRGNVIISL